MCSYVPSKLTNVDLNGAFYLKGLQSPEFRIQYLLASREWNKQRMSLGHMDRHTGLPIVPRNLNFNIPESRASFEGTIADSRRGEMAKGNPADYFANI